MNGFSNDMFGSGGFRTMGTREENGEQLPVMSTPPQRVESFTPWSHGIGEMEPGPALPAPRLQLPQFGPAHSFALAGERPGFLGAVRMARRPRA